MISTLPDLIAPLSEAELRELLRSRRLTFRPAVGDHRYASLLDWKSLRSAIERGVIPLDKLRITYQTRRVAAPLYLDNGKVAPAKLTSLLDQGVSLIAEEVEPHAPGLNALCADIRTRLAETICASAVMTTGSGGALALHYDTEDIIVIQLEGSKRWRVYGPPVVNPLKRMPKQTPPQNEPVFDKVLQPGDFLFLPGGYWHHCDNGPELSLHVAILFGPPTGWHALRGLLPQLLGDEIFRVPLTRFHGAVEKARHEAALKTQLIEKIGQMSLSDMLAGREKKTETADRYEE